jgi:hypothetical protein
MRLLLPSLFCAVLLGTCLRSVAAAEVSDPPIKWKLIWLRITYRLGMKIRRAISATPWGD